MQELKRGAAPLAVVAVLLGIYSLWEASNGHLFQAAAVDLMVFIAATLVVWPKVRWLMPVVAPLLVAGAFGQFRSQSEVHLGTVVPAALGLLAAVLLAVGVDVNHHVDRGVRAFGRGLEAFVGGVAFCFLVVPAWAWTRLRRREVLRGSRARTGPSWATTAEEAPPRSLGSSPDEVHEHRTAFGRLTWAVGCVTVILAINFGIGWAWDQKYPTDPPPPPPQPTADASTEPDATLPPDPLASSPAMAAYPWSAEYFESVRKTPVNYWPYTEYRPADFSSKYVNQRDWIRESYQPRGDADAMPTVWMFGGSTTWGIGQRDQYTIASYLARIAEEEGIPIQISNYGEKGWVHFQEMILYEQLLAANEPPDVALFYDGANELTTQSLLSQADPSHTLVYAFAQKLYGATVATEARPADAEEPSTMGDAIDAYTEHSAIHKVVGYFRSETAGATPTQDGTGTTTSTTLAPGTASYGTGIEPQPNADESGTVWLYDIEDQDGIDAAEVYERGKDLTLHLSDEHDVDALLYWQPLAKATSGRPQELARERITEPTIDISDALDDHDEVYLDSVHTNEEGARIIAERIWQDLEPKIRAWYRQHR